MKKGDDPATDKGKREEGGDREERPDFKPGSSLRLEIKKARI